MTILRLPLVLGVSAALALSACTDPASLGSTDQPRTATGALTGGVVGAVLGSIVAPSGKGRQGAILGGIVGATTGALVGNQLDKQAAEMRAALDNNILVETTDNQLIVTLPEDITFDTDSTYVRPSLQTELAKVAASLVKYPDSTVQVIGHTDNVGDAGYNQGLSERRADSVAAILRANGVAAGRIVASGRGESEPKASNLTAEGRAQNRRVEIIVTPV